MNNNRTQRNFDDIYENTPLDEIPWNHEEPPELMVELVESSRVKPCRTLDVGCGAGNYAVYLASRGFDVTGIDISPAAIKIAKRNAKRKNVSCAFLVADVVENFPRFESPFGFVYDWGLLHHIMYDKRPGYIGSIHDCLSNDAVYMSLCFNDADTYFEGEGKIRDTIHNTQVYLSSEAELRQLWEPHFEIMEFQVFRSENQPISHVFNFALLHGK
jgi:SAM-dependent methyltransferase